MGSNLGEQDRGSFDLEILFRKTNLSISCTSILFSEYLKQLHSK